MKKLLLLLFSFFFVAYQVKAQTFSENFESYTIGDLVGQGNWVANSKYAGVSVKVDATSLSGTKSAHINPGGSGGDGPVIPFNNAGISLLKGAASGTIYTSFLVKFLAVPSNANGSYFFYLADLSATPNNTDGRGRIYVKPEMTADAIPVPTGKFAIGAIASSNSAADVTYTPFAYELNKNYLVIEKYEKVSATTTIADKVSLWIYSYGATQSATEVAATVSNASESAVSKKDIQGVGFRTFNSSDNIIIDNIKVDGAWANVLTAVPLPVKLTSFTAIAQNNSVKLNWATASEQNNDRFEVLRSEDGATFNTLASVTGNGTSQSVNNYSYTDANPLSGTNYYQLRQVDFDGKSELSKIVAVKTDLAQTDLKIHASSADTHVQVSVYALTAGTANVTISDASGVQVAELAVQLSKGYNVLQVPAQTKPGVYVLTLKVGTDITRKKFISQ